MMRAHLSGSSAAMPEDNRTDPLRLAVVGHTNTGKTSLLRTLTRDGRFGEVSSRPSTTRHVEGARLSVDGRVLVELYDTPGMEDAIGLGEWLDDELSHASQGAEKPDGPARIACFLDSEPASARFEQEAKVLRQLIASDAGLYVVDARDPVLAKHREELALLAQCARPLLPVLNFVRDPRADVHGWREALARLGLHAVVLFDTVAPERDAERLLYGKLASLLDWARPALDALVVSRERESQARHAAARTLIGDLLVDVAACQTLVSDDTDLLVAAVEDMNNRVRVRERRCADALLDLYGFDREALDELDLPWMQGRLEDDLFHPESLRAMGVKLGSGAAAGAAAGFGLDVAFGGLSLGAATAIGALAGGGLQALRHYGGVLRGRLMGERALTVDDSILRLIAVRQAALLDALERRGHAATAPLQQQAEVIGMWRERALPSAIWVARAHPHWSALYHDVEPDAGRTEVAEALADVFLTGTSRVAPQG